VQPRRERAAAVEAVERADDGENRFLCDVLGRRGVVHDQVGGAVRRRPVTAEQLVEGLGRPALRRAQQCALAARRRRPHPRRASVTVLPGEV